MYKHSTVL